MLNRYKILGGFSLFLLFFSSLYFFSSFFQNISVSSYNPRVYLGDQFEDKTFLQHSSTELYGESPPLTVIHQGQKKLLLLPLKLNVGSLFDGQQGIEIPIETGFYNISSGFFSERFKKAYFFLYSGKNKPLLYHHMLFIVNLENLTTSFQIVSPEDIFPNQDPLPFHPRRFHCQTPPILIEGAPPKIQVGCSVKAVPDLKDYYGETPGLAGRVLEFELNKEGGLTDKPIHIIPTSKELKNKAFTGYDSGVYQARTPSLRLNDGSSIWATGNGPVDFSNSNYGCSLVRIKDGEIAEAHSQVSQGSLECWVSNSEYSNSSYVSSSSDPKAFGGIVRKDGVFEVFRNDQLARGPVHSENLGSRPNYSSVIAFDFKGKNYFYVETWGKPTADQIFLHLQGPAFLLPPENHIQTELLGYAKPPTMGNSFSTYQGGELSQDYPVLESSDEKELTPFSTLQLLQGLPQFSWGFSPKFTYPLKPLFELGGSWPYEKVRKHPECFVDANAFLHNSFDPAKIFWLLKEACLDQNSNKENDLFPVYFSRFLSPTKNPGGLRLALIEGDGGRFKTIWSKQYPEGKALQDHPSLVIDPSRHSAEILTTIAPSTSSGSHLLIMDALTGEIHHSIPFQGTPHFTWAVPFKNKIYLGTLEEKLVTFSFK